MIAFLTGVLLGMPIGATLLRDWLQRPAKPAARRTIPLAFAVRRDEYQRLDAPTVRRAVYGKRQRMPIIDVD